jgi:predicted phage terminase large subunit-like protein
MCVEARLGRSEYQLVFVPWYWQEEYKKTLPDGFLLTAEEEECKRALALGDEQVYWRRRKIGELGSLGSFCREYPATVDEAFLTERAGALWTRALIEKNRRHRDDTPEMRRIVVAVDPAITARAGSDETGIIVAGLGADGHGYVLEDLSGKYTPAEWAARVAEAFARHRADRVIAEVNQGGDMVEYTLRTADRNIPFRAVHASRGKVARAEPVAALDEQGRIHHAGMFPSLEDQMCRFNPAEDSTSPDRVDARIWAMTDLMLGRHNDEGGPKIWS